MTKAEAEKERIRLARQHPKATWLISEEKPGAWSVVKVGLEPADKSRIETTEQRPKPPYPDDPVGSDRRNLSKWGAA